MISNCPTYEIHPIAEYYYFPLIEGLEFDQLVADIKARGQIEPADLLNGKILDGRNRARACAKLGIELKVKPYENKLDPYDYVWSKNFLRRHLTNGQKEAAAAKRSDLTREDFRGNRYQDLDTVNLTVSKNRISTAQAAQDAGVSRSNVEKAKTVRNRNEEVFAALEQGKLTTSAARNICLLPKNEQAAALEEAVTAKSRPKEKRAKFSTSQKVKIAWTDEEKAKDKQLLAQINEPSIFPADAHIPQSNHHNDVGLRRAIEWLKAQEPNIADYRSSDLYDMLLRTNRIQAYKANWFNWPHPDGEPSESIYQWASSLWRKQQYQHQRLDLRAKLLARKRNAQPGKPIEKKATKSFDERFETFRMIFEDSFTELFSPSEYKKVIQAFKVFVKEFLPSSLERQNGGAANVADAS